MTQKIHWRCFHCGETFTLAQRRWAAEHFGRRQDQDAVCMIREAGESMLLHALRKAEDELAAYRAEDQDLMRAMYSMSADHAQALIREKERGYAKALADVRKQGFTTYA